MIIKIIILAALVKLLISTDKPLLCSGIYTIAMLVLALIQAIPPGTLVIFVVICAVASTGFFFLLNRMNTGSGLWWLVAVAGCFLVALL